MFAESLLFVIFHPFCQKPMVDLYQIWYRKSPRGRNQLCQQPTFLLIGSGVSILWGVEICPSP